jgi:hypothetical protein
VEATGPSAIFFGVVLLLAGPFFTQQLFIANMVVRLEKVYIYILYIYIYIYIIYIIYIYIYYIYYIYIYIKYIHGFVYIYILTLLNLSTNRTLSTSSQTPYNFQPPQSTQPTIYIYV